MRAIRAVRALGPIDAKSVARDPLLRWLVVYPVLLALLLRWGVPALAGRLEARYDFDLSGYYVLLMSFLVELLPILTGMVIGFLLLDGRDDRTLTALQVTPLTLNGYLAYRLMMPMLVSVVMTLVVFPLAGLVRVSLGPLVLMALGSAPLAPLFALLLGAFAGNKVEGFALSKASGVLFIPSVLAYFVDPPWQWAFGLIPTYWPAKAFWVQQAGGLGFVGFLLVGVAYQAFLLVPLLRSFNRVMQAK
jgi:fluoroquinolone transport system permease protein